MVSFFSCGIADTASRAISNAAQIHVYRATCARHATGTAFLNRVNRLCEHDIELLALFLNFDMSANAFHLLSVRSSGLGERQSGHKELQPRTRATGIARRHRQKARYHNKLSAISSWEETSARKAVGEQLSKLRVLDTEGFLTGCSSSAEDPCDVTGQLHAETAAVLDVKARRCLPGHAEEVFREGWRTSDDVQEVYYQRVDVLAKSGEMASFTWRCVLSEDGKWLTDAVVSDHWNDHWACVLAYGEPSPRFSPEAVIQAQLALLRAGDFRTCMAFSIGDVGRAPARLHAAGPNARLERFIALLEGPRHFPLVRHRRATMGTATLKRNKFSQIAHVETMDGFYADFEFVLSLQPSGCWSTQAINRVIPLHPQPTSQVVSL
ncbi:hypothetical protein CYMTET_6668 [Cymbomonas tetramitiformis]|uniref:Uncharacterized protein n=1 Tax=Cymbomonas tetramitiformis TaxID=36881 RepID=A0AAE0LI85_9CHLO|nr:hypothetical protein CYMTET_6668 [Cymbomonas tetramitiformis]